MNLRVKNAVKLKQGDDATIANNRVLYLFMRIWEKGHSREGMLELRAEGEEQSWIVLFTQGITAALRGWLSGKDCG